MSFYTFFSFPKYQLKTLLLHFTLDSSNQSYFSYNERNLLYMISSIIKTE